MNDGRPFLFDENFAIVPSPVSQFYFPLQSLDLFHYSIPSFFKTETLSLAISLIPGSMSSLNEILPNLTSKTLHGRARGHPSDCAYARARGRGQSYRETRHTLFLNASRSSTGSVNQSPAQKSVPPLDAALLLQTPIVLSPSSRSNHLGRRSQTDLAQGL